MIFIKFCLVSLQPGKRSLLLKEIAADNATRSSDGMTSTAQRQVGQTKKRKNMSMAQQCIMDLERQRAIDLYRQYKNKKLKVS